MHDYKTPRKVKIVVEKTPAGSDNGNSCECLSVGDEFVFDFERCPANFCASAFHSLWPALRVLELGGRHPWDEVDGVTYACCPDAARPVTFRLEVIKE